MKQKIYRLLAIYKLRRRYEYLVEVDKLMEEFTTKTILDGGSKEFIGQARNQLVNLQKDIQSKGRMLEFLYNSK